MYSFPSSAVYEFCLKRYLSECWILPHHIKRNENKIDSEVAFFNSQVSNDRKFDNSYLNKNTEKQLVINSDRNVNMWEVWTSCHSVQFSRSVVSGSLWPHEPQHTRPRCPSLTTGVHSYPCPSSRWCHPAISSSVIPFSSCPQSFPASGSFPMSQLFTSGGQSIAVSASTSVLPMNTQDWSLGWTGWNSL